MPSRHGGLKSVEGDGGGIRSLLGLDEIGTGSVRPVLQLFDGGCTEGVSGCDDD